MASSLEQSSRAVDESLTPKQLDTPWCCELKRDGCPGYGYGVIVELPELNLPHSSKESLLRSLPGLRRAADKICSKNATNYVLITCHCILPGLSNLQGWTIGFGKNWLSRYVNAAVSCCGVDGIIGPPGDTSLKEHPSTFCPSNLDFTVLFLNTDITEIVSKQVSVPQLNLTGLKETLMSCSCTSNLIASVPTEGLGPFLICQKGSMIPIRVKPYAFNSLQPKQLRDQVDVHKRFRNMYYSEYSPLGSIVGLSGSPIVHYSRSSNLETHWELIGIHSGENKLKDKDYTHIGITICGIFQLLQGECAAFFTLMTSSGPQPRRAWASKFTYLIQCHLGNQKIDLGYLVEILDLLLEKCHGTRLISLRVKDLPADSVAALNLLSGIFKCFEGSTEDDITTAVSEVVRDDGEGFTSNISVLCSSVFDLLDNANTDAQHLRPDVVKACFHCCAVMLNFTYKDLVEKEIQKPNNLADLEVLRVQYKECIEIQRDFGEIFVKCRLFLENENQKLQEKCTVQAKDLEKKDQQLQTLQRELKLYKEVETQRLHKYSHSPVTTRHRGLSIPLEEVPPKFHRWPGASERSLVTELPDFYDLDMLTLLEDTRLRDEIAQLFVKVQGERDGTWEHLLVKLKMQHGVDLEVNELDGLHIGEIVFGIVKKWGKKTKVTVSKFSQICKELGNTRVVEILEEAKNTFDRRRLHPC